MRKRFAFDTRLAIATAWDVLWASNLKQRKDDVAYEKKVGKRAFNAARTYYICAADVERLVRDFAEDTAHGRPWRTTPGYGGVGFGGSGIRMPGGLSNAVRDWLLRGNGGKIVSHNFGRRHISGQRFRPVGEPLAPAEEDTMAKKIKDRDPSRVILRHFAKGYSDRLLCVKAKRHSFSRHRSKARRTSKFEEVTCPRCKKLLDVQAVAEPNAANWAPALPGFED